MPEPEAKKAPATGFHQTIGVFFYCKVSFEMSKHIADQHP